MKFTTQVKIESGKIRFPKEFFQWVEKQKDKTIDVYFKNTIERTLPQNNFFHGVICRQIEIKSGQDFNDIKNYLKDRYLPKKTIAGLNGEKIMLPIGTSELSKDQMIEFLNDCIKFAHDFFGIVINNE